jgi:hypothetical protein
MAQHRTGSTGEHGGHQPPSSADRPVPHGVNPGIERVESSLFHASVDRSPADPNFHQLPARHHTVLPSRELGYLSVTWAVLTITWMVQTAQVAHDPYVELETRTRDHRRAPNPSPQCRFLSAVPGR